MPLNQLCHLWQVTPSPWAKQISYFHYTRGETEILWDKITQARWHRLSVSLSRKPKPEEVEKHLSTLSKRFTCKDRNRARDATGIWKHLEVDIIQASNHLPTIHLPIYPSTQWSIHPSIYLTIYLPIHPSIYPSIQPTSQPTIYPTIHHLAIHLSYHLAIHHPANQPAIIYPSILPSKQPAFIYF